MSNKCNGNTVIARLIRDRDPNSEATKFFADPENQKKIAASLQDAMELNQQLREARQVTPEMFERVVDI